MSAAVKADGIFASLALLAIHILTGATIANESVLPVGKTIVCLFTKLLKGDLVAAQVDVDIGQHDGVSQL
jgi:hypothetical protein